MRKNKYADKDRQRFADGAQDSADDQNNQGNSNNIFQRGDGIKIVDALNQAIVIEYEEKDDAGCRNVSE